MQCLSENWQYSGIMWHAAYSESTSEAARNAKCENLWRKFAKQSIDEVRTLSHPSFIFAY